MDNPVSRKHPENSNEYALIVYYGPVAREYLEALLGDQGLQAQYVAGREANAGALIEQHPAELVVIDADAGDISTIQAVRQIGRLLPNSLVFKVHRCSKASVYRAGRQVGEVENSCITHFANTFEESTGRNSEK